MNSSHAGHSLQVFGLGRGGIDVAFQKFPEIIQILVGHRHLPLNQQDVLVGKRQKVHKQKSFCNLVFPRVLLFICILYRNYIKDDLMCFPAENIQSSLNGDNGAHSYNDGA